MKNRNRTQLEKEVKKLRRKNKKLLEDKKHLNRQTENQGHSFLSDPQSEFH